VLAALALQLQHNLLGGLGLRIETNFHIPNSLQQLNEYHTTFHNCKSVLKREEHWHINGTIIDQTTLQYLLVEHRLGLTTIS
jgi:hypothetical protein